MQVKAGHVVTLHYTLRIGSGNVLDSTHGTEPLRYLHGHGDIIPGLERRLEGRLAGEKLLLIIPAAEAYGEHDEALIIRMKRENFPEGADIHTGMRFKAMTPGGRRIVEVVRADGDNIRVDANHPLAGVDLEFDLTIDEVRPATPEELAEGRVLSL